VHSRFELSSSEQTVELVKSHQNERESFTSALDHIYSSADSAIQTLVKREERVQIKDRLSGYKATLASLNASIKLKEDELLKLN